MKTSRFNIAAFILGFMLVGCACTSQASDEPNQDEEQTENTDPEQGGNPGNSDNTGSNTGSNTGNTGSSSTGGYTLVWSDEFNSGSLDATAWNVEVNGDGGGNNELQYYLANNISVGDDGNGNGCLILTARKESYGGKSFTSGRLNTKGKKYFTYGKIEARIKMPQTANGLWPAFWMLGNDIDSNSWPRCGEIDIVEMGNATGISNGTQDRYFNGACHWGYYKDGQYPNYGVHTTNSYSLQDGKYHTFTLVWTDTKISMYVDLDTYPNASPYYEMNITDKSDDWGVGYYFHKPYFIVFDLAVGGNFPQIWSEDGITALANGERSMYVDYVRVYQK